MRLEIEYLDWNGGGIETIESTEELKDFMNYGKSKENFEVTEIEEKNMKVRDIIKLLGYSQRYEVRGGYSGRKLFDDCSTDKTKEKYLDFYVVDEPIKTKLIVDNICENIARSVIVITARDYDYEIKRRNKEV